MLPQAVLLRSSRTPLVQFQRFRGKINIQRPRDPHYERARVLAVTQPKLPEKPKALNCFKKRAEIYQLRDQIENPYNEIIAREVRNWLENSKMVAIFHLNPISQDDLFNVRVQLHKHNMHLKSYGKKIIKLAVENTKFEAILTLFDSQHCIVFSPDQHVTPMLRIVRKVPQMLLMAGIVDNTLLSRNEFLEYAQLPGIQAAQAELVQTLNSVAGTVVQQLEAHQNNFVNILDVHARSNSTTNANVDVDDERNKV